MAGTFQFAFSCNETQPGAALPAPGSGYVALPAIFTADTIQQLQTEAQSGQALGELTSSSLRWGSLMPAVFRAGPDL